MLWKVIKLQHKMQKASANCKLRARCFAYVRAAFFFCCNMQYVLTKKKSLVSGKDFQNFRFFLQRMYRCSRKLGHRQEQTFIFSVFEFYIKNVGPNLVFRVCGSASRTPLSIIVKFWFQTTKFWLQTDRQTDGQTDRQTDRQTDAINIFWAFLVKN